jgi:ribosomal protein S18 acetylase RimI-like enzyme
MPSGKVSVRAARPGDREAVELLYVSAAPYYDVFAGSGPRARRILGGVWARRGHTASYEVCRVAELDGNVVGVMAAFPVRAGDRLARRFLGLSVVRMPAWRWPAVLRHLRASARVTPAPPAGSLYVDALAVAGHARRHGVASALLADADELARAAGLEGVALDTGIENEAGQALYEAAGFERCGERLAPDERTARAVGGAGFVSYYRATSR